MQAYGDYSAPGEAEWASGPDAREPRVLSKAELLRALTALSALGRDYRALLESVWEDDAPDEDAQRLLAAHRDVVDAADGPFTVLGPAQALLRFTVEHLREPRVAFRVPWAGPAEAPAASDGEHGALAEAAATLGELSQRMSPPLDALAARIYGLARGSPAAREPRVRRLLGPVAALGKAIARQDWRDAELVLEHLHVASTTRDSEELVAQIGRLVRAIHSSLNELSQALPLDALTNVSEELPGAVDTLRQVVAGLEAGAHRGLDRLETLTAYSGETREQSAVACRALDASLGELAALAAEHPAAADALGAVRSVLAQGAGELLNSCAASLGERHDAYMTLLANQSYQDLTGQTLGRVIAFIESLQYQLIQVVSKERGMPAGALPSHGRDGIKESGPDAHNRLSQDRVDEVLAQLGF